MSSVTSQNKKDSFDLLKVLQKCGYQEQILFSIELTKINKRSKGKNRILMITNKAIYNIKNTKKSLKIQRRIELNKIASMTTDYESKRFKIYIPEEYNWHYHSDQIDIIIPMLTIAFLR